MTNMKTFKDFLTESKKTYKFLVRIAGDLPENMNEKLNTYLEKFQVVNVSEPKRAPITESPMDFPQLQNVEVHTWEVEVQYPTTRQVMQEYLSSNCDVPDTHINVRTDGDPVEEQQNIKVDTTYEAMLNTEDMGGESAQADVAGERVMSLLKELEKARQEREIDATEGIKPGESSDITNEENATSVIGS